MTTWKTVDEFYQEEKAYRGGGLLKERLYDLCSFYDVEFVAVGHWAPTTEVPNVPDVLNNDIQINGPSIRWLFDHFYTFKTYDGKVLWVVCPYDHGFNALDVQKMMRENGLITNVHRGFYADYTIVIDPIDMLNACLTYSIKRGNITSTVVASTTCCDYRKKIVSYDDPVKTTCVLDGINRAIKQHVWRVE